MRTPAGVEEFSCIRFCIEPIEAIRSIWRASCGASDPYLFFLVMGRHAVHDAGSRVAIGYLAQRQSLNENRGVRNPAYHHKLVCETFCMRADNVTRGCQYK